MQGKLDINQVATEKTDGQNLFITWNGKLLAARNAGDIKRGGVDSKAIAKKFAGRGNIEKAWIEFQKSNTHWRIYTIPAVLFAYKNARYGY